MAAVAVAVMATETLKRTKPVGSTARATPCVIAW
jgi:hypothetical protein